MGTLGSAAAVLDEEEEEEEEKKRGAERLPPLLEDEENVSLADILCLREGGLSEQELWAVCVECVCSLQSIGLSPLFHTLCVTPDTLAFNAHGNVCFMEQLNDDPDGCFVPPEFDKTGSTFEGHMFSLGSTLWAALDSVSEAELQVELSEESRCLLKQMQREKPEDRPPIQDLVSQAEAVLGDVSSAVICRKLSSIGRRVLSIESIAALQDGWEKSSFQFLDLRASRSNSMEHPAGDRTMKRNYSSDSYDGEELLLRRRGLVWSGGSAELSPDSRSQNSSPVHRRSQERRPGRARRALNRSCSVPDSNNPPALSPPSHTPISMMMADLSEITEEEGWSGSLRRTKPRDSDSEGACETDQTEAAGARSPPSSEHGDTEVHSSNIVNKSVLCLKEESQNQWISLRDLLSLSSQPFSVSELWALCFTCLSTLQTYIDLPDYLCLDSVYVGCEGEMLFLRPKNSASCDAFFLAPEFQEHGIVTEKACVYGVAAVLWATAKFHLSPDQKLAMPRKLKRLLLEMAKRTPIERPSIEMAKKSCRDFLSRQGTNAESVWTQIIIRVHQAFDGNRDTEEWSSPECAENPSDPHLGEVKTGFVPLSSEGRLEPVAGPVPHHYPESSTSVRLPEAFTSPATHFSPIILTHHPQSELGRSDEDITDERILRAPDEQEESAAEDDGTGGVFSASYSSSSSCKTLVNSSPPATLQITNPETDDQPNFPVLSCANGICNNFLLQQDPQTGRLTLLPVQITVLQPITGSEPVKLSEDSVRPESVCVTPRDSSVSPESPVADIRVQPNAAPRCMNPSSCSPQRCSSLEHVMELLTEEFALDGVKDLAMGKYIISLKSLQFETFCRAITEKFSDVHWDQKQLCDLHRLIKQHSSGSLHALSSDSVSDEQSSSEAVKRAAASLQITRQSLTGEENAHPDHNANLWPSDRPATEENQLNQIMKEPECKPNELKYRETADGRNLEQTGSETRTACWRRDTQEMTSEDDNKELSELMQCGAPPDGGAGECVCDAEALEDSGGARITPDSSELDMDDCDSLISERMLSVCSGPQRAPCGSWALALYGDQCFSPDVLEYTQKLSSHSQAPTLEDKSQDPHFMQPEFLQELHQQLIIESRNLKKSRTFYHKLIQQERKNKGSDMKVMVSKVKQQFDELRAKVEFLQSVKKYLQVLSVDQWGLELSLLPSLVVCGDAPLELQHSDDPALLHFLCEQRRGKGCPLVAATARGLMAYLYARNAHADGFVQQFFYTYRYFCTPEELLRFLMDKLNSSLGANEDPSSDTAKVYQRTLDLLHFWIEDAQLVDFSSSSSLLQTLDAFLTAEVAPVESRGAGLLATLQASPMKRRICVPSCALDASISSPEDEEKLSVNSSIEDAARKSFQWRVSRVVEPQTVQCKEKVFSIAAALPRPCYTSLMNNSSLRSDERRPFSQSEHTPLHIAQQLTLLEQEIFHDCHPVHFLNSRAHGVTENSGNISRCVSPSSSPLEGSGLLVSEVSGPWGPLQRLLTHAHCVSNWVSAELVTCDSVKAQAALLARFLSIGKFCYETRNFSTALQILSGLENVIVRQLPAWKQLSLKMCETLEELRAVQVFLKSDNLCLMEGEKDRRRPTLPDALILAIHIQQLEIGAFTVTSGAYKWPKLRNIARVVSQIQAFQERLYSYPPDLELQAYLRGRLARFGRSDISLLASDNHINFSQMPAARRIHDTLRRVKASFQ
ncbi:kinase non-catalytic C-lobe domain-containing protein 1 isoform X1 [Carassius gibelio]|uniref:kinase non-catalytic C-lobe domain-containing protein 1 isoform X1 n=1 Tax=Carassius gibelio TaxID=101364 RepID=UPI0022794EBC|nr:kinase non-catalytic C-lobe domain-containing protein 1 isoform X1 [Carassius gibelio]